MTTRAEKSSLVGMSIFLGGWTMLFAALLFVWADFRVTAAAWPPDGAARAPLLWPSLATVVIAASSWTLAHGRRAPTVMLGVAFVALQLVGFAQLWRSGVTPSSGRYGSIVYTLVAFHALHVVVGLGGVTLSRARTWRLFWHFVGAVWLVLFVALFLAGCTSEETRGRIVYDDYCRPCHGEHGDGRGFSSVGLRPPPRDFTDPLFKFGHVEAGQLPPDSELERIIRKGLNGTAMLPWDLSADEMRAVIHYIKHFSPRWKSDPIGRAIEPSPDPWLGREGDAIARGAELYKDTCSKCHETRELKTTEFCLRPRDQNGDCIAYKELPPDLRCDPLRSVHPGSELVDLYRTIASGIPGAGMPTWKGALPEADLWAFAYYVRSIRPKADQTGCRPSRTGQ